jgi:tetratricopeptide (TPR) repeat protein
VIYALARLLDRRGMTPLAAAVAAVARRAGAQSAPERTQVGTFLADHGWDAYAAAEFGAAVALEPDAALNARYKLAVLAAKHKRYAQAAAHYKVILDGIGLGGAADRPASVQLWGAYHLQAVKAALAAGDTAAVKQHLDEVAQLPLGDAEVVMELVPIFRDQGRAADAKKLFAPAYAQSKQALDQDPGSPEMMNNLAWLCARAGERLGEAVDLSRRAVALDPVNAAYLDTAAEAMFQTGDHAEAVRLETEALKYRPDDEFMIEQLERFRNGK